MQTTQHNTNGAARLRTSGAVITLGTHGTHIATHVRKWEMNLLGNESLAYLPILAIETAESSRTYSATAGPSLPPVTLPDESVLILPERDARELARIARRFPGTRRYAAKLESLPNVTTKEGAGGHKILALAAGLAALPEIEQRLLKLLVEERDRCRFNARCEEGTHGPLSDVLDVYFAGAGYGSTFSGLVLLMVSLLLRTAGLLKLTVRVHVIITSPSVARTHDPVGAWSNFASTFRALLIAMEDPSCIVFHGLDGSEIRNESQKKLVHSLVPWGASTGTLVAGDRDEVANSIALTITYLAHSPLGGLSESAFTDPQKLILDHSFGFRGARRLGLARFALDPHLNRRVAVNAATRSISKLLNPETN